MSQITKPVRKKDAMALLLGKPVYTDDLAPRDALVVKLLRSPHASAEILSIDAKNAMKVPGVVGVYTYDDVPHVRFATAGQAVPEWSPYDHLLLDRIARYVGDPVAIVAGETEESVDRALKLIKVEYRVLPAVLDFRTALDNPQLVHAEEDWRMVAPFHGDPRRNLCAYEKTTLGDVEKKMRECAFTFENTYHVHQVNQCCMETYRAYTSLDAEGRLNVLCSTQIPFHVRRVVARALQIPQSMICVAKPRIGGGFGSKQTSVCEMYPAFVTWKTGRGAKLIYTRKEFFDAGNPRHEMEIHVKIGADREGRILAVDERVLSNTGAYGEHGPTTISLSGHQPISIYRYARDVNFEGTVVYTNTVPCGAYRGFGLTQGAFALESAVNELAHQMGMDPLEVRRINALREGDSMAIYNGGEITHSCRMDACLDRAAELFSWADRSRRRVMPDGKVRAGGMAMAMQGSGIAHVDTASATVRLIEDGTYLLEIGAADMGTGCDTILAQMAAECLQCSVDNVRTAGVNTDRSPYDTGSYASSTTYVTGGAVVKASRALKEKMMRLASEILDCEAEGLSFRGDRIEGPRGGVTLQDLCFEAQSGRSVALQETASNAQPISPPPFIVGMAEVEVDPETGEVRVLNLTNVVDCGTVINTNLARVQAEGAAIQALGMALTEKVQVSESGRMVFDTFMNYGLPTRLDIPQIQIDFCPSYEESGPFGAKSIGEIVINATAPAIADAVWRATGIRVRDLPITPEKLVRL